MWGMVWACKRCGQVTFSIDFHVCDDAAVVAQEIAHFQKEFVQITGPQHPVTDPDWRRFCWTAFDSWCKTVEGRFALYYVRRWAK